MKKLALVFSIAFISFGSSAGLIIKDERYNPKPTVVKLPVTCIEKIKNKK